MRMRALLVFVLGTSCALWGQTKTASWDSLNTLQAGQKIQVQPMHSKKISGTFLSVSPAAISIEKDAVAQSIQRQDVRSVRIMKNKHRLRNTLICAGIGGGIGAGIFAAAYKSCSGQPFCIQPGGRSLGAAIGAVAGLLGGAVVGAVIPDNQTLYEVAAQ